jgi:hypothetical protein
MAVTFLKTGAESAKLAKQDQIKREAAKTNAMFRFYLKEQEEARITFVDGDLDENGFLCPPRFYEHSMQVGGKWGNFYVCPEQTDPSSKEKCPLCVSGDKPTLVAVFTVIDHRQFKSKDGTKTYKNTKKLFVAKPHTFELLNKLAMKRGGLTGVTFDVSRGDKKTASVGSLFDFVEKKPLEELQKASDYMIERVDPKTNAKTKVTNFTPADYAKEIVYRTGEQLAAMGFGAPTTSGFSGGASASNEVDETNYAEEL